LKALGAGKLFFHFFKVFWTLPKPRITLKTQIFSTADNTAYTLHRRNESPFKAHREGTSAVFASKYQCKKLIYYEHYRDVRDAIARESQLKVASEENQPDQSIEPTILVLLCYKTDKSTDLIRSLPVRSVSPLPVYVATPQPLQSRLRFAPLEMTGMRVWNRKRVLRLPESTNKAILILAPKPL
jgi:predicted GIY-YIG superfamily endonuclease